MPRKTDPDCDPYFEAYRIAKAKHRAAASALKRRRVVEQELIDQRAAAAAAEFKALSALLRKPRAPLAVEVARSGDLVEIGSPGD